MAVVKSIIPVLTPMQELFAEYMAETGDAVESARRAQYAQPDVVGRQLAANPSIMMVVRYRTQLRVQGMVPHSLNYIEEVLCDSTAPKGVRLDAAKTILDRAGFIAPRPENARKSEDRPLNEFSVEELRKLLEDLNRQRGDEARLVDGSETVDSEPVLNANDAQVIDPME